MFLFASDFLTQVGWYRAAHLRGGLGTGKTLLAVALADWFLRNDVSFDYVVSNVPTIFPTNPDDQINNSIVIYDEAWMSLDARQFMKNETTSWTAFSRKFQCLFIFPSAIQVDKRVRPVFVERVKTFEVLPWWVWVYRWQVDLGYASDYGFFILGDVRKYFPYYIHSWVPIDDGGVPRKWKTTHQNVQEHQQLTLVRLKRLGFIISS